MTEYTSPENRTKLAVSHDEHGCAVLSIYPAFDPTERRQPAPIEYGIHTHQLPRVLLDMAGGEPTEEETEDALNYLGEPENAAKGMEDLLAEARMGLIVLKIRADVLATMTPPEPDDVVDVDVIDEDLAKAYEENEQLREVINTIGAGLAGILEALGRVK